MKKYLYLYRLKAKDHKMFSPITEFGLNTDITIQLNQIKIMSTFSNEH